MTVRRTRLVALMAVAGAVVASVAAFPASAQEPVQPGIGIRLVDAPTDRADDPRAHIYIVDHLAPGDSIERRIEVSNGTGQDVRLLVYPLAAAVDEEGFTVLDEAAEEPITDWISADSSVVELNDGERRLVDVTIDVPSNATAGEHYAAILAELPAEEPAPGTVAITNRVGVRVYLSVGAGGEPPSDFGIESLGTGRAADGRPFVSARIRNTGERALDLLGELQLTEGPAGLSAGPFPAEGQLTLAPGDSGDLLVLLDPELPSGPWRAEMVARSGGLERAAEATITFPEAAGEQAMPVQADPVERQKRLLVPLATTLILLTTGLLVLFLILLRGRRREEEEEGEEAVASKTKVSVYQ